MLRRHSKLTTSAEFGEGVTEEKTFEVVTKKEWEFMENEGRVIQEQGRTYAKSHEPEDWHLAYCNCITGMLDHVVDKIKIRSYSVWCVWVLSWGQYMLRILIK